MILERPIEGVLLSRLAKLDNFKRLTKYFDKKS